MKATEQRFPVVLFLVLYKVLLTFEPVDEILKCDYSNESYWAVLFYGAVYYVVQGCSNFWICGWNPKVWLFKWKLLSGLFYGAVYYVVQGCSNFWVCGWNPNVWLINDSYWAVLTRGTDCYCSVQGGSIFWACGWNTSVTIQTKATDQHFSVVLFIMLYKVILSFWVCGGNP